MTRYEVAVVAYARWVIRWRYLVIALTMAGTAAASFGLTRLRINESWRVFFQDDNPYYRDFKTIEADFTRIDNVFFGLEPRDGDVFNVATLTALDALTTGAWQIPFATRVDSLTNFQYSRAADDDIFVGNLVEDPANLTAEALAAIRAIALAEPTIVHRVLSADGSVAGVNVAFHMPENTIGGEQELAVAASRALAQRIEAEFPAVRVHTTGLLMLNNAFKEAALQDYWRLMPVMYAAIALIVLLFLRSIAATVITLAIVGLSTLFAEGMAGWLGIHLTAPSTTVPPLIMTLAVADSVHILSVARREMRAGLDRREALVNSLVINTAPVFLTSLTTVIGFLSMNFSDSPPLWDVGNVTSIGVAAAYGYAVLLLPALVAVFPMRADTRVERAHPWTERLADFLIRNRRTVLLASSALIAATAALIPLNELNDRPLEYFDENLPFRQASEFVMDRIGGAAVVEYALESGSENGIADPRYLATMDAFAEWFRAQPGVVHVNALTDTMKRLNKNMHGDDPAYFRVPEDRALAAQYLLFYEMSLPYGLDLNNQIDIDKSASRFIVITDYLSSHDLDALAQAGTAWLQANAPPAMAATASGSALMFAHLAERNVREMVGGTLTSLLLISGVILIALRSLKYGMLSLVPNVVPQVAAFGVWGVLVGKVSFALSTVSSMSLGIVVDDTVHFISHYVHARRRLQCDAPDAVRHAYVTVGPALAATTVVLCTGFLILSLSSFSFNRDMALLSAIVIAWAALADAFYLPSLLLTFDGKRNAEEYTHVSHEASRA